MNNHLINEITSFLAPRFEEKFNIPLQIKSATLLGGGCISNACKLITNNGIFFLKWNSNAPGDLFIREAEALKEFKKSQNEFIIFPKPILFNPENAKTGYLMTDFLEQGKTGNDDEKLGRGLAMLHKVSSDKFGFVHDNYCGATTQNNSRQKNWITFYTENRISYLINLIRKKRSWSYPDDQIADTFLSNAENMLQHNPVPSLIHGDLWSGNYMYTVNGPALIDPAACYCDREFEMGIMTMFGGFSNQVYDAYNEIYPLSHDWKERNMIYQLYHVLNHYYLFGGYYKTQALEIMRHYC